MTTENLFSTGNSAPVDENALPDNYRPFAPAKTAPPPTDPATLFKQAGGNPDSLSNGSLMASGQDPSKSPDWQALSKMQTNDRAQLLKDNPRASEIQAQVNNYFGQKQEATAG